MPDSMSDQLAQELTCESLLECFHGLKTLDKAVFGVLTRSDEPLAVDDIAEAVDRERSTAYRSAQRLCDAGIVQSRQMNYADGGYYHVFEPVDAAVVAEEMQQMLNDWYTKMRRLIDQYQEQYEDRSPPSLAAER